jgi:DNA-binding NarL/FixJ family response regulator
MKKKVYIADDHAILREGLRHILQSGQKCEVVGESGDGQTALDEIGRLKPDVIILDISMPGLTGVEVARKVKKYYPDIKIIILSRHDSEEYIQELVRIGINGYVLKDEAGSDLLKAVESLDKNEIYLSPRITSKIMYAGLHKPAADESENLFTQLTGREREILQLIAEGKSGEETAKILCISSSTVKVHRQNLMKKLGAHKAADLVKYAVRMGLIEP